MLWLVGHVGHRSPPWRRHREVYRLHLSQFGYVLFESVFGSKTKWNEMSWFHFAGMDRFRPVFGLDKKEEHNGSFFVRLEKFESRTE